MAYEDNAYEQPEAQPGPDEQAGQPERSEPAQPDPGVASPASEPTSSAGAAGAEQTSAGTARENAAEAASDLSDLDQALLREADLKEQLARRTADLYNLQQEYSSYVKRSKAEAGNQFELGKAKVVETLIGVLDNAALAREHGELAGPAGKVVEELESTLATNFGVERYGAVGDAFDPEIHEALMHSTSAEVEFEQVQILMQPGYRMGKKVLRPARVGVVSPE